MSNLFVIEHNRCKPIPETLLISPLKEIWEMDLTPDKTNAIRQLTFIELYSSMKLSNPYSGYPPERRLQVLAKELFNMENANSIEELPNGYMLQLGIDKLNELQTEGSISLRLTQALINSLELLITQLPTISVTLRTDKGLAVYKPSDILSAVSKAHDSITSLEKLKETILKEDFSITKMRGNRQTNRYEE